MKTSQLVHVHTNLTVTEHHCTDSQVVFEEQYHELPQPLLWKIKHMHSLENMFEKLVSYSNITLILAAIDTWQKKS